MRSAVLAVVFTSQIVAAQPALDDRRISGRVVDELGRPVANAAVTVWRVGRQNDTMVREIEATTRSGADGAFAFSGLFPTHWLVDAETRTHNSYLRVRSEQHSAPRASANVSFSGVAHATDVVVTVYPAGTISGRVLRPDGTAVPNARVNVAGPGFAAGYDELPVRTNGRGDFRIDRLPPGSYIVSAVHFIHLDFEARRQRLPVDHREYVETFYPAADERERAAPVTVRAGAEASGTDIRLAYERGYTIVGRIVRLGGRLPSAISLEWGSRDGKSSGAEIIESSNGAFVIRGVLGEVGILARAQIDDTILNATTMVKVASGTVRNVFLSLAPAARVRGKLVIEGGHAVPHAHPEVSVALEPPWPRSGPSSLEILTVLPDQMFRKADPEAYSVPVFPDGTFEFTDVIGERTFAVLNLPAGWTMKEVRHRGRVIVNGRVTFRPRDVLRDVEIHIATR